MKTNPLAYLAYMLLFLISNQLNAQVGIGTVSPNSTLDVRGSFSLSCRSFSSNTTICSTDNTLVFTGTADAIADLPDAASCTGRIYQIKNASAASVTPPLTIIPIAGQLIEGLSSWVLSNLNESVSIMSNGVGWFICSQMRSTSLYNAWSFGGNSVGGETRFGTSSNMALPFITNNLERMRISKEGRIGIGHTNPLTELHIFSSPTQSGITNTYVKGITISANGSGGFGGPGFYLENLDNPAGKRLFKINYTANGGSEGYINYQAVSDNGASNINANILTINHSGRVGVGTATFNWANPEKFVVDAGYTLSNNIIGAKAVVDKALRMYVQNGSNGFNSSTNIVAIADNGDDSVNQVRVGINSSGHTGSNLVSGANKAYLYASGNDFVIGNTSPNKEIIFFTDGLASANQRLRINANGVYPGADNAYTLGNISNRWTEIWSANGVVQTSDLRLKSNIRDLPYGLKELMQLRAVAYSWNNNPQSEKIGLIAQEVQQVIPEVVTGDAKQEMLGMNYAELVPLLINAIKDLKKEVEDLKKLVEQKK